MAQRGLLRVLACGSVDDGKSTLLGRLMYDTGTVPADQLAALEADSRRFGTQGGALDFALLLDGLTAEREQGVTIDVAYRYFSTPARSFIVADAPGHEQYTRNMATGASTADVAVLLVDATRGLSRQTRRHAYIASLLGVREAIVAVNKMDLLEWSQATFDAIVAEFEAAASSLRFQRVRFLPVSALHGDNIARRSQAAPWYVGPCLLELLERIDPDERRAARPFRLPVQQVLRPDPSFRGYAGLVASGEVKPGDPVRVLPSGRTSTVARLVSMGGDLDRATAGESVTLTLSDELDVGRGDVLAAAGDPPPVADQFQATLVWLGDEPMLPGRAYLMKIGPAIASATVTDLQHRIDVDTLAPAPARTLELNEIGEAKLALDRRVAFEPYDDNRELGGFILIDRVSDATVAAGMIRFALRRSDNIHWQALDVDKAARAALKGQRGAVLWFTGLSGAGKSTIANLVEKRLHASGRHTYLLDGDNVRHGLNRDLGFTDADRVENIRRVAEVAKLMVDAGLIVLVSFISPFRSERRMARDLFEPGEFAEVFVDAPLEVAEARDAKGLYAKARAGELKNFTGIDSPYEPPERADLTIDAAATAPEDAAEAVIACLESLTRR